MRKTGQQHRHKSNCGMEHPRLCKEAELRRLDILQGSIGCPVVGNFAESGQHDGPNSSHGSACLGEVLKFRSLILDF